MKIFWLATIELENIKSETLSAGFTQKHTHLKRISHINKTGAWAGNQELVHLLAKASQGSGVSRKHECTKIAFVSSDYVANTRHPSFRGLGNFRTSFHTRVGHNRIDVNTRIVRQRCNLMQRMLPLKNNACIIQYNADKLLSAILLQKFHTERPSEHLLSAPDSQRTPHHPVGKPNVKCVVM